MGIGSISVWQLLIVLLVIPWAILWILTPFILMGINKKLIKTNQLLEKIKDGGGG